MNTLMVRRFTREILNFLEMLFISVHYNPNAAYKVPEPTTSTQAASFTTSEHSISTMRLFNGGSA